MLFALHVWIEDDMLYFSQGSDKEVIDYAITWGKSKSEIAISQDSSWIAYSKFNQSGIEEEGEDVWVFSVESKERKKVISSELVCDTLFWTRIENNNILFACFSSHALPGKYMILVYNPGDDSLIFYAPFKFTGYDKRKEVINYVSLTEDGYERFRDKLYLLEFYKWKNRTPTIVTDTFPQKLFDGNLRTAEEFYTEEGGKGYAFKIHFAKKVIIERIRIAPGYMKTSSRQGNLFFLYNRIKKLKIITNSGDEVVLKCKNDFSIQEFNLKNPLVGETFIFLVEDIYRGSNYNRLFVSEIEIIEKNRRL